MSKEILFGHRTS